MLKAYNGTGLVCPYFVAVFSYNRTSFCLLMEYVVWNINNSWASYVSEDSFMILCAILEI